MRSFLLGRVLLGRRVLACCGLHLHIHHLVQPLLHFDFGMDCMVVGVVGKCWGFVPIAGPGLLLRCCHVCVPVCLHTDAGMCAVRRIVGEGARGWLEEPDSFAVVG